MSPIWDLQRKHPPWRVSDGPRCCAPDTIAEFNGSPESPPLKGPIVWRQCEFTGEKAGSIWGKANDFWRLHQVSPVFAGAGAVLRAGWILQHRKRTDALTFAARRACLFAPRLRERVLTRHGRDCGQAAAVWHPHYRRQLFGVAELGRTSRG